MTPEVAAWIRALIPQKLGYVETMEATFTLASDVLDRGVPGDFVEAGVYAGAECAVMARAIMLSGQSGRRVHLFDSFQGIPAPGPEDHEFIASGNQPGSAACSLDGVSSNMARWGIPPELLVYHAGWFSDTLPDCGLGPIALLRLDGDLYESTKVCMQFLYPLVSHGGWVIVDDYPLSGCRKAIHEVVIPQPSYFQRL